ncbi:MAG: hypothetical protein MJ252_13565 [archaeon]|nr:hypothetical protein [archaeon]
MEYNLNPKNSSTVDFLYDYTKELSKRKLADPQIFNWIIENSLFLKATGVNMGYIKNQVHEVNKRYFRYDTFMNQIQYRLDKHGCLAPLKDIAKKLSNEELEEAEFEEEPENEGEEEHSEEITLKADAEKFKENLKKRPEANYYNQNDPFIDDSGDVENYGNNETLYQLLRIIPPGNYDEEEILNAVFTGKSQKKKVLKGISKKKVLPENKEEVTQNSMIGKKRKMGESFSWEKSTRDRNAIEEFYKLSLEDYTSTGAAAPSTQREQVSFLMKVVPSIKKMPLGIDPKLKEYLLSVFSSHFNMKEEDFKILLDFEVFKSKIEGSFSNFSKIFGQFISDLSNNGVTNFSDVKKTMDELKKYDGKIKERFEVIIRRILTYKTVFNEYYLKEDGGCERICKILEPYVPDIWTKPLEYYNKMALKIQDIVETYKVSFDVNSLYQYATEVIGKEEFINDDDENPKAKYFGIKKILKVSEADELDEKLERNERRLKRAKYAKARKERIKAENGNKIEDEEDTNEDLFEEEKKKFNYVPGNAVMNNSFYVIGEFNEKHFI